MIGSELLFVEILLMAVGALLFGLALPLWRGRVPPNFAYGFRTPLTVHHPEIWYPINAVAGRDLAIAGIAMILGALLAMACTSLGIAVAPAIALVAGVAPPLLATLHSFFWASRFVGDRLDARAPVGENVISDEGLLTAEGEHRKLTGHADPRSRQGNSDTGA